MSFAKSLHGTIFGILLLTNSAAFAESTQPDRTFSVDSGYLTSRYAARAFWNFGIEFDYLGAQAFDSIANHTPIQSSALLRGLWGAATYFGWRYPQNSFFVSNHEFGHAAGLVAAGGTPSFGWDDGSARSSSIFSFFVKGFSKYGRGADTTGSYASATPTDWDFVIGMGGVNSSASYSEALEDEVQIRGGHILQYIGYVRGKQDTYNYVRATQAGLSNGIVGDMATIKSYYDTKGYGISLNDMKAGSQASRWASATHWAYIWGALQYALKGDPTVRPFNLMGFKLPDFSQFLTRKGLSYKIRSGFRGTDTWIPLSIEYVYKGDQEFEFGTGYNKLFNLTAKRRGRYGVDAFFNSNGSYGTILHGDFPLSNRLTASAGASFFKSDLLIGAREIASLMSNPSGGYEVWARLSAIY